MEKVLQVDLNTWRLEKHVGAGRDPRLLCPNRDSVTTSLFRDAVHYMQKVYAPPSVFEGNAAATEVAEALASSGLEPAAWVEQFIAMSELGAKSSQAIELRWTVHALHLLGSADRLNLRRITAAEHLARRVLQIQRAVRKDPRSPLFEGLDAYSRHLLGFLQPMRVPEFDKVVTEAQKVDALIMNQDCFMREETAASRKRERDTGGRVHEPAPKRQRTPKAKAGPTDGGGGP